jgi:primary-amine oxidase
MDGTIHVEPQLTGILLAKGSNLATSPCVSGCKPLVEKNVLAPPHQHFFNFRIDFDIDGATPNRAAEVDVRAVPKGPANPDGNAFEAVVHELLREKDAVRDPNPAAARKWKVFNSKVTNAIGHPTGYALVPAETAVTYLRADNQIRRRARFIEHAAWFTVYHDEELSAAARYPTTAPEGEGLPSHVADNESLRDQDIVMWYTFGVTHVPRPEEWPVMNAYRTGFTLMPMNFFSRNPFVVQESASSNK